MYTGSRFIHVLALAAGLAVAAPGFITAAGAAPAGVAVHHELKSRARIVQHWTRDRMRNAQPPEIPGSAANMLRTQRVTPAGSSGATAPGTTEAPSASGASLAGDPRTGTKRAMASYDGLELPWLNNSYGTANPINPVGRLYFTAYDPASGWYDSYCSGTLVAANIVLTAAHCVRDGTPNGVWSRNLVFAPGVNGYSQPFGRFAARSETVKTSWYSAPYYNTTGTYGAGYSGQDYAFVVLSRNATGQNAGDVAGRYAFYYGAPKGDVYHLGYPGEGNWNGCTTSFCRPWHCASPIQQYSQYGYGKWDVGFSCFTTGGASGGPIFQQIDGRWYVTSVMSHMGHVYCQNGMNPCPRGEPRYGTTFFGSYFDQDTVGLFQYARTL